MNVTKGGKEKIVSNLLTDVYNGVRVKAIKWHAWKHGAWPMHMMGDQVKRVWRGGSRVGYGRRGDWGACGVGGGFKGCASAQLTGAAERCL